MLNEAVDFLFALCKIRAQCQPGLDGGEHVERASLVLFLEILVILCQIRRGLDGGEFCFQRFKNLGREV